MNLYSSIIYFEYFLFLKFSITQSINNFQKHFEISRFDCMLETSLLGKLLNEGISTSPEVSGRFKEAKPMVPLSPIFYLIYHYYISTFYNLLNYLWQLLPLILHFIIITSPCSPLMCNIHKILTSKVYSPVM